MDWETLDNEIGDLEHLIEKATAPINFSVDSDWSCVFEKCREIQQGFDSKPYYPTKALRDAAWVRFNALRSKAFNCRNEYRTAESKKIYNELIHDLMVADYNLGDFVAENTFLFFAKVDSEDMKEKGELLRSVRQRLKENKNTLIHEHQEEIWSRILSVQAHHDDWWGKWKAQRTQREEERQAKAVKHEEWLKRHEAWKDRVRENLNNNRGRLEKAENALAKCQAHAEELREKLETAWNDDFKERVEDWLEEEEERITSIEENIERIKEWIEEDERKLSDAS